MRIAFTFRHLDPSDAIRNYASEKLSKIQKYLRAPLDAEVTLSLERHYHQVEVILRCDGHTYVATQQSEDMYASIDLVTDTIESQVRRLKGQEQDRRHRNANSEK